MTAIIETHIPDRGAAGRGRTEASSSAPRICAAWARSGLVEDHVVYERDGSWVFAGGRKAGVVLTARDVTTDVAGVSHSRAWSGSPSDALAESLAALPFSEWSTYGWIGFDFCAPALGSGGQLDGDAVLAHLVVPEFEAWIDDDGIRVDGADAQLEARLRSLAGDCTDATPRSPRPVDVGDDGGYRDQVARAVAEIRRGDYEKVILSRVVDIPFDVDIAATYECGRRGNNPARSFLLRLGGLEAAGFSPELVGSVDAQRMVITEPLAGTRAFGRSDALDRDARAELVSDAKEIVEHAVSVRTSYEEVASVSVPDTTAVTEFMVVRERGSVQHLASTVRGMMAPDRGPWDVLSALFPSVTASGIPKTAAVEAIYRLESERRGLYSGAVVTASSTGELEATLALRTVYRENGRAWIRAGAGIVAQSTPDREFTETCEKLGSIAPYLVERSN